MIALIVVPIGVLLLFGLIRRFQIARTQRELERMGFVGSASDADEPHRLWPLVEAAFIGLVALIVATMVLPGPPAGRMLASTDGSPLGSTSTHAPAVSAGATPGSEQHSSSDQPAPTHGTGSPPSSPAAPASTAGASRSDPGAPSQVTALPTSATAITLRWAPVSGAARYHVERSTDSMDWKVVASPDGDQTRYTDAALDAGTTYYYRVAAFVEGQDVARSDVVSATTTVDTPAAPVLLSATSSATSIGLAWSDVDGELGYSIERSPDGTTGWTSVGSTDQNVTSFTDAGLASGTTYYYRVIAVITDGGSSPASGVLSATTAPPESSEGPSTSTSDANAPSLAPTSS